MLHLRFAALTTWLLATSLLLISCAGPGEKLSTKSTESTDAASKSPFAVIGDLFVGKSSMNAEPVPPAPARQPLPYTQQEVSTTVVKVQCETPAENYDFSATIGLRFGAEGQARLQTLMASNFRSASLTPRDKAMLRVLSTEMLWIPVPVEEQIGNALLLASSREMTVLGKDGPNAIIWKQSIDMVRELSAVTPPNPFELRLILLEKGEPGSLAGGVIYLDDQTITSVFDKPTAQGDEKLRFIVAHELAHIYKRHRAKRIQQVLVESDAGLTLMRQIVNRSRAGANTGTFADVAQWAQTATALPEVVKTLMSRHEQYAMSQESEADACATAMMMSAKLGDPLRAFRAYAKDAVQMRAVNSAPTSPVPGSNAVSSAFDNMRTHPPDAEREANIGRKMREFSAASTPRTPARAVSPAAPLPTAPTQRRPATPARPPASS